MLGDDETTDDPVIADVRNFYKVELWTRGDRIERMLFAGTSLDKARSVFADYARCRPGGTADDPAAVTGARVVAEGQWVRGIGVRSPRLFRLISPGEISGRASDDLSLLSERLARAWL